MININPGITYNNSADPIQYAGGVSYDAQYYEKMTNGDPGSTTICILTGLPANTNVGWI